MVIDTHVHLVIPGFVKGKFLMANARMASSIYNRVHGTNITPGEYIEKMKGRVDPNGTRLIETMDAAGIDKSIIFGVDWAYSLTGEPRVSNRDQNRAHAEMARKWEGRLLPLAALDPRRPDVLDQAKEAIEEWGMKGFKLHPSAGFFPNDPICFPLYEKCADWRVPIVFHTGGIEVNWEYGQPIYVATAAEHYPEVKMVMAHAGLESWDQARLAATALPNVYVDLSIRQLDYKISPQKFYGWLRDFIDWTTPWKILFASDAPMPTFWCPMDEWVDAIKKPMSDVRFTQEEIEIIMGKAAQKVFTI